MMRLRWNLYLWLFKHANWLAWKMHGLSCPSWCQGHQRPAAQERPP